MSWFKDLQLEKQSCLRKWKVARGLGRLEESASIGCLKRFYGGILGENHINSHVWIQNYFMATFKQIFKQKYGRISLQGGVQVTTRKNSSERKNEKYSSKVCKDSTVKYPNEYISKDMILHDSARDMIGLYCKRPQHLDELHRKQTL